MVIFSESMFKCCCTTKDLFKNIFIAIARPKDNYDIVRGLNGKFVFKMILKKLDKVRKRKFRFGRKVE